jgi:hypothetical protein
MAEGVPNTEIADLYRRKAKRFRRQADVAETIEMRVMLLEAANQFDQKATDHEAS